MRHYIVHLILFLTIFPVFAPTSNQENAEGLVLQCIDRMLRPPCWMWAGAIISMEVSSSKKGANEKHAVGGSSQVANLRKVKMHPMFG